MSKPTDKDLFANTTMTFGEHLEELRACLFKAVVGLAIGFVLGLLVGDWVVDFIQRPLRDALTAYYQKQSLNWVEDHLGKIRTGDQPLPWTAEQISQIVNQEKLLPEEAYVDPAEILRALKKKELYQEQPVDVEPPPSGADKELERRDLLRIFVWHRIEDDLRVQTKSLSAHEAFMTYIKAALLVGALIASPWIFYQIWSFVAAGLYPHEKQYVHVFLPFSLGLFLLGAAMAFFFVFKPVLNFLFYFNSALGIDPDPRISEWLGFVLVLPLGFGISFQLPLVMLFLERIGVFDVHVYLSRWRIAILVIFTLAMFLTPADPTSMMLMAVPLTLLYFGGILLCHYMPRSGSPFRGLDD